MKLIYVMDPLCGWCYGNSTNTEALSKNFQKQLDFEIIPAGMWAGQNARMQSPQMASYFKKHDLQIAHLTGTKFGEAYFEFIEKHEVKLDSEIPSRAILTVQELWKDQCVSFMAAVQQARYLYGKDLNANLTYLEICKTFKIDEAKFLKAFESELMYTKTQESFQKAIQYASSYPTLLFENNRDIFLVEQGYSTLDEITERINELLKSQESTHAI